VNLIRLEQDGIHSGLDAALLVSGSGAGRDGDDELAPLAHLPLVLADAPRGLEAVDVRHVAVHQNEVVASAAQNSVERLPAIVCQVLIYPVTNSSLDTPSYHENATGYVLTREAMRWFWRHYLEREEQGKEPLAAPLLAPSLAGLPPALVITAACDPLRDEGEAYAARLRDAGVPVTLTRYDGMFHGFIRMTRFLDKARAAVDEVAGSLRKAFA